MKLSKFNRDVHRWGSIIIALPMAIIIISGVILQLKKESAWIQPTMQKGSSRELLLSFDQILEASQKVPEAEVESWDDIDRLDVRPDKGMLKVRCKNRWEIQLDTKTGDVLQAAYRRSDQIESIHDGSFIHPAIKLWIFFPAGIILLLVWVTGIYMFIRPYVQKNIKRDTPDVSAAKQADAVSMRGFTLVELLVVIAILGVLMSILMPALGKARQSVHKLVCLANLRRLAFAGLMYTEDEGAFPPHRLKKAHPSDTEYYVNKYGRERPRWQWFFDQGVGPVINPEPWVTEPTDTFTDDDTLFMTNDYFICPAFRHADFDVHDIRNGSYGYNYQYLGSPRLRTNGQYQNYPVKAVEVKHPSRTIMLGDGRGNQHPHGEHSYKLDPPLLAKSTGAVYFGDWKKSTLQQQHTPAEGRHNDKANISFVDGHAETITLESMGYVRDEKGLIIANHSDGNNQLWSHTKRSER